MEFDILTLIGTLVMATLAFASGQLHFRSRAYAKRCEEDHERWQTLQTQASADGEFSSRRAQLKQTMTGPLGDVLRQKVELFPDADSDKLVERLESALAERNPERELDGMARLAMFLVVGNILGTLGTSAFLNTVLVFAVGLIGILLNMGTLGRVERLRGLLTRAAAYLGGMFLQAVQSARPSEDLSEQG